jgi:hypothetical protein
MINELEAKKTTATIRRSGSLWFQILIISWEIDHSDKDRSLKAFSVLQQDQHWHGDADIIFLITQ